MPTRGEDLERAQPQLHEGVAHQPRGALAGVALAPALPQHRVAKDAKSPCLRPLALVKARVAGRDPQRHNADEGPRVADEHAQREAVPLHQRNLRRANQLARRAHSPGPRQPRQLARDLGGGVEPINLRLVARQQRCQQHAWRLEHQRAAGELGVAVA